MSKTAQAAPAATPTTQERGEPDAALWRVAGAFALGHVVLVLAGIALQDSPLFTEGVPGIQRSYVEGRMAPTMAGGMVEAAGFLLLLPALAFLARAVGQRTEVGRWAAQTGLTAGAAYVAVSLAVGLPAGAAALYGAQHGLDADTAFALNNLRIFGYFLSLGLLGLHAIGLAVSARQDRMLTRWVGWGGVITGVALLASVPASTIGQQDWGTLVWLVWWCGVAIALLRHRVGSAVSPDPGKR